MYLGILEIPRHLEQSSNGEVVAGDRLMLGSHLSKCIQGDANDESVSNEIKFKEER